jgi:hypothetical protein
MPPPIRRRNKLNLEKPKKISEIPSYLKKLIGGFISRLIYIFTLVWETRKWIFFALVLSRLS